MKAGRRAGAEVGRWTTGGAKGRAGRRAGAKIGRWTTGRAGRRAGAKIGRWTTGGAGRRAGLGEQRSRDGDEHGSERKSLQCA
jgi:hypothetical protein